MICNFRKIVLSLAQYRFFDKNQGGNFTMEKFYLFTAVAGTTVFVIQFLMTIAGLHGESDIGDFDVEAHDVTDIHGVNFFSLKSIVAFITFFGWGGVFWGHLGWGGFSIAFVCGLIMMTLTTLVLSLLLKMQQSGNLKDEDFIGRKGKVYLSIPAERAPGGKVTVYFPGCTRQVAARSDEAIDANEEVVILEALGGGEFSVKKQ
jgi:membrane protein implicated in regulation of membrane protease activity